MGGSVTKRQAITPAMKIDCLLHTYNIICRICGAELLPGDRLEWDHIHAISMDGPHDFRNLRPTHAACNRAKGIKEHRASAKVDRLLGLTCNKPKKKIPSRPWAKRA